MLQLSNPRFDQDEYGYPYLSIEINGEPAKVSAEQKAFNDGFIFLGSEFEDILPPLTLPADPSNGRPQVTQLFGFSDDSRLIEPFNQFLTEINSDSFIPHNVSLP
jgi:hypothetical protein